MIRVEENVRFKKIPPEMIPMFHAIDFSAKLQGKAATITGASYENYPVGKVHDQGYAIDVRVSDIPRPWEYADSVRRYLGTVSSHYVVLFGDRKHLDHIHIGFSWWFSRENQEGV